MLHYESIDPETLGLLKKIQSDPDFYGMRLVGGTSLALQLGHRKSIDLDFFGSFQMDNFELSTKVKTFGNIQILKQSEHIYIYLIDGIKTDFVQYQYQWLEESLEEDDLILAKKADIAAMKLAAITGRGTKKDFIDIYFLLKYYSLEQMLQLFEKKYSDGSLLLVLKSLTYFEDAEKDPDPKMLIPIDWQDVKQKVKMEVRELRKI